MSKAAPYGQWVSPIDADVVVSKKIVFADVLADPITNDIYHLEERPEDQGRCVIVHTESDKDVLPYPFSARSYVLEYGGASAIIYNNIIYFSNASLDSSKPDNSIYTLEVGESVPTRVTPVNPLYRYADFALHPTQNNLLVTLREDHTDSRREDVVNTICVVDMTSVTVNVLIESADFYSTPRLNPSGNRLSWQEWNLPVAPWKLPGMPWDSGLIYVVDVAVDSGTLEVQSVPVLVAGEAGRKSATFPTWIEDTTLAYLTDGYTRYQNPYIYDTDTQQSTPILNNPKPQDFAPPQRVLGLYPYAILGGGTYGAFTAFENARNILYIINLTRPSDPVLIPFDFTVAQRVRAVGDNAFVFIGSTATSSGGIVLGTVSDPSGSSVKFDVLKYDSDPNFVKRFEKYISKPQPSELKASDGHSIYIVYYDPYNQDYRGSNIPGERPPCIIHVHGRAGPTGMEPQALNWIKMFYTSRGFAWVDVNYRGSSGYGREYLDSLNGYWGIYDVQDCKEAARILSEKAVDGQRVAIRGGSGGAYTTLASVTLAADSTYKTACGAHGCVVDVEYLTTIVEKFEMRYVYTLFGSAPDDGAWDSRNPIKHASQVKIPFLMLQGLADRAVRPETARNFLAGSCQSAPSGKFVLYPNEGHNFFLDATRRSALTREYHWYLDTLL